jgi:hypothetical protein
MEPKARLKEVGSFAIFLAVMAAAFLMFGVLVVGTPVSWRGSARILPRIYRLAGFLYGLKVVGWDAEG